MKEWNKNLCSPTVVKELLAKYQLAPQKGFGQNFLINARIPEEIAESSVPHEAWNDSYGHPLCALEIGPGLLQPLHWRVRPRGGGLQQVKAPQEGRLPRPGRADDHHLFSGVDVLGDIVQHQVVAEGFRQIFNVDHFAAASFPARIVHAAEFTDASHISA